MVRWRPPEDSRVPRASPSGPCSGEKDCRGIAWWVPVVGSHCPVTKAGNSASDYRSKE